MNEIIDLNVVDRAVQGDVDAFSILYEQNIERIYNYIYYRTGNAHEAEDLTARVFFRALGHIQSFQNLGVPFSAWLYRIAHNLVANWHRDRSRRQEISLEDYIPLQRHSEHPETLLIENMENEKLLKAIRKLPSERQHLLVLKFVEDLPNAEIAVIMGRSEGAIKGLYHRTVLSLRDILAEIDS